MAAMYISRCFNSLSIMVRYFRTVRIFTKFVLIMSFIGSLAHILCIFMNIESLVGENCSVISNLKNKHYNILIWQSNEIVPIKTGESLADYISQEFMYSNCLVTTNKYLYPNLSDYHAIVLDFFYLQTLSRSDLPRRQYINQMYVFYGMWPSDKNPICDKITENYFNLTWSYKSSSDIVTPFITVKNISNTLEKDVLKRRKCEASNIIIAHLDFKKKAVAWIPDSCKLNNEKKIFAKSFNSALSMYNLKINLLGCRNRSCPFNDCYALLEKHYVFYLVYESSREVDYISTEVLKAYNYGAIPIIVSGAKLDRYLPESSYLDGGSNSVEELAGLVNYIMKKPNERHNYHKWRSCYTIQEANRLSGLHQLCSILNKSYNRTYTDFRRWWYNGPLANGCKGSYI